MFISCSLEDNNKPQSITEEFLVNERNIWLFDRYELIERMDDGLVGFFLHGRTN